MRDRQAQYPAPKKARFEPTLGHCLMDSDPEAARAARRNRRRSLALSTAIQASLLTAAIVVPLFAGQTIPGFRNEPRIPAPRGITRLADPAPAGQRSAPPANTPLQPADLLIAPPRVPENIAVVNDIGSSARVRTGETGPACPACVPDGTLGLRPDVFGDFHLTPPAPRPPVSESRPSHLRVSPRIQEAKLIHRVDPRYPPLPRQIGLEGKVELQAVIASNGTIRELEVLSGHPMFVKDTLEAVKQWRYQPTLYGNEPIEVVTRITVLFILSK